jgi:hypothetical protein
MLRFATTQSGMDLSCPGICAVTAAFFARSATEKGPRSGDDLDHLTARPTARIEDSVTLRNERSAAQSPTTSAQQRKPVE